MLIVHISLDKEYHVSGYMHTYILKHCWQNFRHTVLVGVFSSGKVRLRQRLRIGSGQDRGLGASLIDGLNSIDMAKLQKHRFIWELHLLFFVLIGISWQNCCLGYHIASDRGEQLGRLSHYDIVTPYLMGHRERRQTRTQTEEGHLREATFVVPAFGKELTVDLQLNDNLLPSRYVQRSYAADGGAITRKPHAQHHCYYHGQVRNMNQSSVAVSTCNGIRGVINVDGESFYIEPLVDSSEEHVVYRHQDRQGHRSWVFEEDLWDHGLQKNETQHHTRSKRDLQTETKYIELAIVNDYQEYLRHGQDVATIENRSKEIANIMDMIYRPMNIRIVLVGVVTWTQGDPFVVSSNPATTMAEFQRWRKENLITEIENDNGQFLTGVSFDGSTVGMASLSTMCSDERSGGVSQDHDTNIAVIASTMAHEMGHNLGIRHDATEDNCVCEAPSNVGCVMEPSSGPIPPTNFSSCSYDHLAKSLESGLGACLFDYPDQIFDGPICGNGFQETGEECDCGTPEECVNDCCIAATCRLHENATCATGACCEECSLKKAGEVCRGVRNECDLPEYCTGLSEECPANVYMQNGEKCADRDDATCYNGRCLTLDGQCEDIWGEGALAAHELCFDFNAQGSSFGNCGGSSSAFQACGSEHVKCGKLMCMKGKDYPVLSSLAKASQGYIWDNNNQQHICKSASIDLGQDVPDPGYVATGTPCKPGFVCSDFQCQNLSQLNIRPCPHNCNGNGVCNSKNHCHCDPQWNPPLCNTPGFGGSIDSGPARDTNQPGGPNTNTVIVLLVMFLCVFPLICLIGFVVYWKRDTLLVMASKRKDKQKTKTYSSSSAKPRSPARPAPVRHAPARPAPTIQHTHMQNRQDEPTVFKFPNRTTPAPQSSSSSAAAIARAAPTRPPVPSSANKPRDPPQLQRPPPPKNKTPLSSMTQQPKVPVAPVRPSPRPPIPSQKPPSPARTSTVPSVPAPPVKPAPQQVSNKPQFRLPPPIEDSPLKPGGTGAVPQRPSRPALRPPSGVARDSLKPVPAIKAKPNINRNNSKDFDEQSASTAQSHSTDSYPSAEECKTAKESTPQSGLSKPSVPKKPVPAQKPSIPSKPTVPNRPALKPPVRKDPVV